MFNDITTVEEITLEYKLAKLRDMKTEIAGHLAAIERLEKECKEEILETGELPNVPGLDVSIRKGYERVTWDGKGLQGYAVAYPEILDFAKKSVTKPSVVIKVL